MSWAAVAVAGGALLGGMMGSSASKKAAREQTAASRAAIAEQARQFDTTRADLAPWMDAGQAGLGRMRDLLGLGTSTLTPEQIMEQSPGYQFRLGQGEQAIDRAAGAQGLRRSGATLKALTRFGQDYASNEFGNIYNRLAGISGTGQQTGTQLGQFGAQNAGNIGNLLTGAANARGAAGIAGANAWGNALNTGINFYGQQSMLNALGGRNQTPTWMQGYQNPMTTVQN